MTFSLLERLLLAPLWLHLHITHWPSLGPDGISLNCAVLENQSWSAPGSLHPFPLSGSNLVQVDFPPQQRLRMFCSPDLLPEPLACFNKTAPVLFTETVPKRVLVKLPKWAEKGRAKATHLLSLCSYPSSRPPEKVVSFLSAPFWSINRSDKIFTACTG